MGGNATGWPTESDREIGFDQNQCAGIHQRAVIATAGAACRREVVMNTPLLTIILVIALVVGAGLTVKKACKTDHHAWCVPTATWHHTKTRAPV